MEDVDGKRANELFKAGSNFVGMYNKNTRFGLILSANDVSLIRIAGRYIRIVSTFSDELPPRESAELIFHMYIGVYDDFSEAINKAREELSGAVACLNRGG
jgi:hypothetical protein